MGVNMMFHPASLVEDMPVVCQRLLLGAASVLDMSERSPRLAPSRSFYSCQPHDVSGPSPRRPDTAALTRSFTLFPELPAEIRELIWSFAIDQPSERLFHVDRLRPASSDPAVAKWRFYRRLCTDTTSDSGSDHDNEGFPASPRSSSSLTAIAVGATCSEARAVLLRSQRGRHSHSDVTSSTDIFPLAAEASPSPLPDSITLQESFNPSRDVLYFDSACLGRLPTATAARSRIKALSTPMLARQVEVLGIDLHCVLSASYPAPSPTSQTCPDGAEDVQSAVLRALCDGFPRLRKIVLITSRQCLPRKRGFTEIVDLATTSSRANMWNQHADVGTRISATLMAAANSALRVPLLMLAAGLDTVLLLSFRGHGHGDEQHNCPSAQGAGGNNNNNNNQNNTKITPSAREVAEEHECCKTLAACLVSPSDLETSLIDMDAGADDVREALARLCNAAPGDIPTTIGGKKMMAVPVVETKVVVRAGGCTGPWTYRARIANGSCSNDEWFWRQKKGTGLPVWKIRDEVLGKVEFS